MPRTRTPLTDQTPDAREREYWRAIVRNEMLDSVTTSAMSRAGIEVLSFRIAKAVQAELAATRSVQ